VKNLSNQSKIWNHSFNPIKSRTP